MEPKIHPQKRTKNSFPKTDQKLIPKNGPKIHPQKRSPKFIPKKWNQKRTQNSFPKMEPKIRPQKRTQSSSSKFVPKNGTKISTPKFIPKKWNQKRTQKFIPKNEPLVGMYLWYPPYGTMQVRRGDLWYNICKKTWFRQLCKHNGSYRGNIICSEKMVCSTEGYLWHNARESAESGGTIYLDLHRMDTLVTIR